MKEKIYTEEYYSPNKKNEFESSIEPSTDASYEANRKRYKKESIVGITIAVVLVTLFFGLPAYYIYDPFLLGLAGDDLVETINSIDSIFLQYLFGMVMNIAFILILLLTCGLFMIPIGIADGDISR